MTLFVGVEAANSFVKAATVDKELCYLNTLRRVMSFEDTTGLDIFSYNGINYIIGEEESVSSMARNEDRYEKDAFKVETLLAVAQLAKDNEEVIVGTGLPSEHFKDERIAAQVKRTLEGEHEVYINGERIRFNIKNVYVTLQPIGSVVNRIYDFTPKVRDGMTGEKKAKKLVVDIGYGTTDIAEIAGLRRTKADGANVGMLDAMKFIKDGLDKRKVRGIQSLLHLDSLIRNAQCETSKDDLTGDEVVSKMSISTGGEDHEILEVVEDAFSYTARLIMQKVENLGYTLKDYDMVLFTGGGVLALRNHLKPYLKGVNTKAELSAQISNAKGYVKYAKIQEARQA